MQCSVVRSLFELRIGIARLYPWFSTKIKVDSVAPDANPIHTRKSDMHEPRRTTVSRGTL